MAKEILKLIIIGLVLFIAGFFLKSLGLAENTAKADDTIHLTFTTPDSLVLHVWKTEAVRDSSRKEKPGLALLLPMMSKTHSSFGFFQKELNGIGYTTLAFDLRGHGKSTHIGTDSISFANMSAEQFAQMPNDIATFFLDFKSAHPDEYNYKNVIIIGASIGANTAGILLGKKWASRAVLLSPGKDYRSLRPGNVLLNENNKATKPIYIAVSNDDTYAAQSSQWLFDNYAGPKVLKKYPGQNHGTNILENVKNADKELLNWIKH